jgi:uncharacterized membrane protein YeiH
VEFEPNILLLSRYFDYSATILWAIGGAMIAARKGYAILGIFVLALISSTGGGLLRDGLFLQDGPPMLLRTPLYLMLIIAATATVLVFGRYIRRLAWFDSVIWVVDALGAGLYAAVGMNLALAAGLPPIAVVMVGMVNAVGGGILRDLLIGEEPDLFKPGIPYALAALGGCILFVFLTQILHVIQLYADVGTIAMVLLARIGAVRFGVRTKPLQAFEEDWARDRGAPRNKGDLT